MHVAAIFAQCVVIVSRVPVKAIEVVPTLWHIPSTPVLIQVLPAKEGVVSVLLQDVWQGPGLQRSPPVWSVASTTYGIVPGAVIVRIHARQQTRPRRTADGRGRVGVVEQGATETQHFDRMLHGKHTAQLHILIVGQDQQNVGQLLAGRVSQASED